MKLTIVAALAAILFAGTAHAEDSINPKRIELTVKTLAAQRDAALGQGQLCSMDAADLQRQLKTVQDELKKLDQEQDAEDDNEASGESK